MYSKSLHAIRVSLTLLLKHGMVEPKLRTETELFSLWKTRNAGDTVCQGVAYTIIPFR